ncbi:MULTISPECIES: ribosome biogenesis factor YjgA [unclassified Colwellia]|uniref:ribosome biogenesis factor YjgA n=2 Tax=unclassified Colwellia TaxID=196834 RepID=UPI0021753FB0|nr:MULTISPECIES: ribosome biogenesis factor YjgA [unclassified Colwellia]
MLNIMPHSANDIDELEEELLSKSEIKREMHRLQDFGLIIVKMSKHQRSKLPLTDELKAAMLLADKITNKHEAMRRHVRHVAKILSEMDLEPIKQAMDVMANKHQQESVKFEKLEKLRDDLIADGNDTIEALLAECDSMERQKLRQLVRQAKKEHGAEKIGKHYRDLFTYLKEHVVFK